MKLQIVLINDNVAEEVEMDDLIGYVAARLLVRNGKRIDFISSSEPTVPGFEYIEMHDWDCKEISLLESIGDPPAAGEDVQYLFTGHGRTVTEIIGMVETFSERMQNQAPRGYLTVVWVVPLTARVRVEQALPQLEQCQDMLLSVTNVYFEKPEAIVFDPTVGVRYEIARSNLARGLRVVLADLEDLDRTHSDH